MTCKHTQIEQFKQNGGIVIIYEVHRSISGVGYPMNKTRRYTIFVLAIMLLSIVPISPIAIAQDQGVPSNYQAQNIEAYFDPITESTTVNWTVQATVDGTAQFIRFQYYQVYRSSNPITPQTISSLTPFATKQVCPPSVVDPFSCYGMSHSVTYDVAPGVNGSFYYGITTMLSNGTEAAELIMNSSSLYEPVQELTSSIRTPYFVSASFDPATSITSLRWINHNKICNCNDLPETGDSAMSIRVWRTEYPVDRSVGLTLPTQGTLVANLSANASSLNIVIPQDTERTSYYSLTYFLPNWSGPNQSYEDFRFLAENTLDEPVEEDNMPPAQPTIIYAEFQPEPDSGGGATLIEWNDLLDEEGETYRIYRSDQPFTTILRADVELVVKDIIEGIESYEVPVPRGYLGYSYYCMVTVDATGVINTNTTQTSCTSQDGILEDAFYNWIAEPTSVECEYLGDRTTRVTWDDQLGVEGEQYHVWHATYRVSGVEVQNNPSALNWNMSVDTGAQLWLKGSVADGVGELLIEIEEGIEYTQSRYFVTTEALYGNHNGTYHYLGLKQNFCTPGLEDSEAPDIPSIRTAETNGVLNLVQIEWVNDDDEQGETYAIWRHYGDPFDPLGDSQAIEDGWELVRSNIQEKPGQYLYEEFEIEVNVDRDVWYAITITDRFNNTNYEITSNLGGNAYQVHEDTLLPNATLLFLDSTGAPYTSPSLVSGSYTLRVEVNEDLSTTPTINITTSSGGQLTGDEEPLPILQDNRNDPNRGPVYEYDFSITSNTKAGLMTIQIRMTDESNNEVVQSWSEKFVDAKMPSVTVFSPSSRNDESQYLYGNNINVLVGAEDDVMIASFQYRFTYHYGGTTGNSVSTEWSDLTGITDIDGDWSALTANMDVAAGNFGLGYHRLSVRVVDTAGNQNTANVDFTVDFCRNTINGTTICEVVEALKGTPDPIEIRPSFTDPPYVIVWIVAGINLLAILVSMLVIKTGMSGPKKKKGDEEETDDWMAEFIGSGSSQELDMSAITGTEKKEVPELSSESSEKSNEPEEDDPFAINITQRKPRRRSKKEEPEDDDDDDDDDEDLFDDDDEDDDDDDDDDGPRRPRRRPTGRAPSRQRPTTGRRPTPSSAPRKRRTVKKSDD